MIVEIIIEKGSLSGTENAFLVLISLHLLWDLPFFDIACAMEQDIFASF